MNFKKVDFIICGAGIIGLCLAKEIAEKKLGSVLILEKEAQIAMHASGRNSGVLHAGIYYPPETLKAKLCLAGNQYWQDYCDQHNLPILKGAKVLVTRNETEEATLEKIYQYGKANGATVSLIDKRTLKKIEPLAKTHHTALHSPQTAIVDPKRIMAHLLNTLKNTPNVTIKFNSQNWTIENDTTLKIDKQSIRFSTFINAAGAHADTIAKQFGLAKHLTLIPFKGIYKKLTPKKAYLINGNIYPVPNIDNPFLGVHFTKNTQGDVYVGPTAIPVFGRENYQAFQHIDKEAPSIFLKNLSLFIHNKKFRHVALNEPKMILETSFFEAAKQLVTDLDPKDLIPSPKCGIRAQLVDWQKKELLMDFKIEKNKHSIHILNAVSPAFTSAMTTAKYIIDRYF